MTPFVLFALLAAPNVYGVHVDNVLSEMPVPGRPSCPMPEFARGFSVSSRSNSFSAIAISNHASQLS